MALLCLQSLEFHLTKPQCKIELHDKVNPSALEFWTRLHSQPVIEFLSQRKCFDMFVATVYSLFILDKMEIFIKFFPSHFLWMSRSVTFQDNNQLSLSTRTSHHNLLARSTIFKHWIHESPQLGPRRDYG